jgi:outer membrane beta-barrel protein
MIFLCRAIGLLILFFGVNLLGLLPAYAQLGLDDFEEDLLEEKIVPVTVAVQQRPQALYRELSGHLSYLPMDHFSHYLVLGGSFTHYFNDYFGWEVVNANYAQDQSTGLEDALVGRYGAVPETFDIIEYFVTSNVVYTPLFMKHLFRQNQILWGDLSLIGGGGVTQLKERGMTNVINFGGSVRFFTDGNWVYKMDFRQMFFFSSAVRPNIAITFALSYNFGKERPSSSPFAGVAR